MPQPLTVIIPCKDEVVNIGPCICSVRELADEILIADSGSTDGTLEVVQSLGGCRIIQREYRWSGDFKNWAIPQSSHPWVLMLDADERIPPPLAEEIRQVLSRPRHTGYLINRLNYFMGHPIRYGVWWPDRPLRLFRRDYGCFHGPNDHAAVRLSAGTVGRLRNPFIHYTFWSFDQYLPKVDRYATVQARVWHAQGRRASYWQLTFRGPLRFLQSYVWKLGFLDGRAGLICSAMVGYQSFLKQARLWELQHAHAQPQLESALESTERSPRSPLRAA
jgi:glycosyltransferase involved in cell wall biosynthesis